MTNRIVIGYFGDQDSDRLMARLRADRGTEVIAVVLDFGAGIPLAELREAAIAAGAARCHALDVREEFARDALLPALRTGVFPDSVALLDAMLSSFAATKLREMAAIEQAPVIFPEVVSVPAARKSHDRATPGPAVLELHFADGLPHSVNGIPMTVTELMECVETITGLAALDVLRLAYRELHPDAEGQVVLRIEHGHCSVMSALLVA